MTDKIRQWIMGDNNNTAGRDIVTKNFHFDPYPIRFFEDDIKEVILCFSEEVDEISNIIENNEDFYRPEIEQKNKINNLSERCFKHIQENSINHFEKIEDFLHDRRNEKYLKKYLSTAEELNNKIVCNRTEFEYFDKIFDALYTYIVEKSNNNLRFPKNLIWIFLHYMYYKCDIGEKYDKAT